MTGLLKAKRTVWAVILLLLAATGSGWYYLGNRYLEAMRSVEETRRVQAAVDAALWTVTDAETAQRGYLLSGNREFLEPFRNARSDMPKKMEQLRQLTSAEPEQRRRVMELDRLVEEKAAYMAESMHLRTSGDQSAALALVATGQGKRLMDAIRALCQTIQDQEEHTLRTREQAATATQRVAAWGGSVASVLTLALALFSLLTVHKDMATLRSTADELAVSQEYFRFLLESTRDLVRLLDLDGKVRYVSPSVESLLGYTVKEFLALPARSLMHPDEGAIASAILAKVRSGELTSDISTYRLRHKNGSYRYFEVRWSATRRHADGPLRIHTSAHDVTERRALDEKRAEQRA